MTNALTVRIADFCKTGSGGTPSRSQMERYYDEGTIPWVKSGELRESVINHTAEYVTEAALKESSIKLVPAGAILLAMYGATVGRLGILGIEATTNQAVCHIVPDPKVADTRYVFHAISNRVPTLISMGVGGAQPNINQAIIKDLAIPLPSLPEQRRIAAILDQADAMRTKRREALAQLDNLTQSIFIEMFGDQKSQKDQDGLMALGNIVEVNPRITTLDRAGIGQKVSFVPMASVCETEKKINQNLERPYDEVAKGYTSFKRGDVLVAKITPCYENGKMAIASNISTKFGFGSTEFHVFRAPTPEIATFIFYFLQLDWVAYAGAKSMKGAAGQKRVPAEYFEKLLVKMPSTDHLQMFSQRVDAINAMKKLYREAISEYEKLFTSLQQRAFQGGL